MVMYGLKKSKTVEPTNYFFFQDFIFPVLKIQRGLGFAPFYVNQGKIKCNFNIIVALYGICTYAVIIILTTITQYKIITKIKTQDTTFNKALVGYLKLLAISQQLLGPLPFLLQKKKFQHFLKKWMIFQEEYQKLTGNGLLLDEAKTWRKTGIIILPFIASIPFLHPLPDNFDACFIIHDITFSVFFLYETCIVLYWFLTSKAIQLIAIQFEYHFKKVKYIKEIEKEKGYNNIIETYRLLWMNMSEITNSFASSIGASITVCLVFHILYLILAAYRTVVSIPDYIKNSEIFDMIPVTADIIFHLLIVLFFCNCTNNMLNLVLKIKEQSHHRYCDDIRISIFLYTINEYAPVASVCGFYEINRSLFGGVVSILVTYMIVIIQLKDSI